MLWLFEVVGFGVGLLLGSFLNVCIVRVPQGESVVRPGSRCLGAGMRWRWFDNVPVLSWVWLRGKCRIVGWGISWRYPAVELFTGFWFLMSAMIFQASLSSYGKCCDIVNSFEIPGSPVQAVGIAILGWLLIGLIVIDWRVQRLPDVFTLGGVAVGMFLVCLAGGVLGPKDDQVVLNSAKQLRLSSPGSFAARGNVFLTGPESLIFGRLAAVCGAALILLLIRWGYKALRKREGLGLGDVKMLAMVAAFLGFWPAVLTLFLGVMLATVYATVLVVSGRAHRMTRLPLGSFSGGGGLVAAVFGDGLIGWYRGCWGRFSGFASQVGRGNPLIA